MSAAISIFSSSSEKLFKEPKISHYDYINANFFAHFAMNSFNKLFVFIKASARSPIFSFERLVTSLDQQVLAVIVYNKAVNTHDRHRA